MPTRMAFALAAATALSISLVGCGGNPKPGGPVDMAGAACAHCAAGGCCNGKCVDVMTDKNNCGHCGMVCATGSSCVGGACGCKSGNTNTTCGAGQTCCPNGLGCKNTSNDAENCGACNHACNMGEECTSGTCRCGGGPACTNGQACCNGACTDVNGSDVNNCGACGNVCGMGQTCNAGFCSGQNPPDDGGMGNCMCQKMCQLGCLFGCCGEDLLQGTCTPDMNCLSLGG